MVCPSERPQAQRRTHRQIDGAGCYDCPRSLCMLSVRRFIGHGGRLLLAVPMLGLMWWSSERTMTVRMPAAACVDEATHRTPSRNDKVIRTALLSLLHSLSHAELVSVVLLTATLVTALVSPPHSTSETGSCSLPVPLSLRVSLPLSASFNLPISSPCNGLGGSCQSALWVLLQESIPATMICCLMERGGTNPVVVITTGSRRTTRST